MVAASGTPLPWMFRAPRRLLGPGLFEAGFLASQMALASDDAGTRLCLMELRHDPSRTGAHLLLLLHQSGGQAGRPRLTFPARPREWSTASRRLPRALPAMFASHGWIPEKSTRRRVPLWNTFYRASTNGGATWPAESQLSGPVRGYDYILPDGFLFPFGNLFSITLDNLDNTHVVWGEGRNTSLRGRSGMCTGGRIPGATIIPLSSRQSGRVAASRHDPRTSAVTRRPSSPWRRGPSNWQCRAAPQWHPPA